MALNHSVAFLDLTTIAQLEYDPSTDSQRIIIEGIDSSVILPVSATINNPAVGSVGSAIPTSAELVGFKDNSGNLQPGNLDSSGRLRTVVEGITVEVGTVSVIQQTTPWVTSGSVAIVNFPATQAVTQSTSPWVTSGTVSTIQGTSPWVTNVSQFGGSNVVTGTGTSGSGIPRVTVSNDSNVLATQSGTWTNTVTQGTGTNLHTVVDSGSVSVTQGTSPWVTSGSVSVVNFPATQPVSGTVTANQGTSPWVVSGSVASIQSGTWNINNISGTVSLPTGAATESTLSTLNAKSAGSLVPTAFDYVNLSYTGSNVTTVVYKTGGSGGTTVKTLTLTYDGSNNLTSVTAT